MTTIWSTDGGIYCGLPTEHTEGRPPPATSPPLRYVGPRGICSFGPMGSGKSRRLLLPNLVRLNGWSILVNDIKGELAAMTMEHRRRNGHDNVVILNPFRVLGLEDHGYNPVAALDPASDEFPDKALALAEAIIRIEGKDPHWSQAAQEIVAGFIMYSRLARADGGSLVHVRSLLALPFLKLHEEVVAALRTAEASGCEALATKLGRLLDAEPDNKEINSVISTALTQTRWLDSPPIQRSLQQANRLDFTVMKERPVTVYLILPADYLVTHSSWLRLMITSVMQPLLRDTRKSKVPILLMLDEFAQLGHLPIIENNLALLRGYSMKLLSVLQDFPQGEALYGTRWESFIANAGVLQTFAPQDLKTSEYFSKLGGETVHDMKGSSLSRAPGTWMPTLGDSSSETLRPYMLPQDLRNMDAGFAALISHKTKGLVKSYFPDPSELPDVAPFAAKAP